MDNANALPTDQAFAHMPTARYHFITIPNPTPTYTAVIYNRSTRLAPPISDRSRLIPELEKTAAVKGAQRLT